jgi:hypothetical protein
MGIDTCRHPSALRNRYAVACSASDIDPTRRSAKVYFAGHGILKAAAWEQWLLSEAASNVNVASFLAYSILIR